jgi:hypothetical protein
MTDTTDYGPDPDADMSQEEQALLLVEPSFDHEVGDEDELLRREFGPPDQDGYYDRGIPVPEETVEPPTAGPR